MSLPSKRAFFLLVFLLLILMPYKFLSYYRKVMKHRVTAILLQWDPHSPKSVTSCGAGQIPLTQAWCRAHP